MPSSPVYAQMICAYMLRLGHLSTTNGFRVMERRSRLFRFFRSTPPVSGGPEHFCKKRQRLPGGTKRRVFDGATKWYRSLSVPDTGSWRFLTSKSKMTKKWGKNPPGKVLVTPLGPETTLIASTRRAGPDKKNRK
mgnify:FL=1